MSTSSTRRWAHRTATVVVLAATTLTGTALFGASGAGATPAGRSDAKGYALVRGAHFSPNSPGVDVYLTAYRGGHSSLWLSNVGYGDVSSYRRLAPGPYIVSMRPHGESKAKPAALSWTLDAKSGAAYTVAAVGMNAKLRGIVLKDRLTPPQRGTGVLRVIQAADRLPTATLVAGSHTVAARAAFASTTAYATVPAGTWTVQARGAGAATPAARSKVSISPSGVYTLVVLDSRSGGVQLRVLRDAAGSATAPRGSIDAGGGGTATRFVGGPADVVTPWLVAAVAALAAGAALALARRRTA